jgi:hypothetical protein
MLELAHQRHSLRPAPSDLGQDRIVIEIDPLGVEVARRLVDKKHRRQRRTHGGSAGPLSHLLT